MTDTYKRLSPEDIRREALSALFGFDFFSNKGALKGGTALDLALGIKSRSSLDIDISIEGDLPNSEQDSRTLERLLREHFAPLGHVVFDFSFAFQPQHPDVDPDWGGYKIEFKVIPEAKYDPANREQNQRVSVAYHERKFKVDVSRAEYIGEDVLTLEFGDAVWRVYTPALIVSEKLRALCQQMPEYAASRCAHRKKRPRDFFDIHSVMNHNNERTPSIEDIRACLKPCFSAKKVPLELIGQIPSDDTRSFHATEWSSVEVATRTAETKGFDYYFDYVGGLVTQLLEPTRDE